MNQLELKFLFLCNFDLHVKLEKMQAYGNQLLSHASTQHTLLPLSPPLVDFKRKNINQDSVVKKKKACTIVHCSIPI
jgi:hypothetical protein